MSEFNDDLQLKIKSMLGDLQIEILVLPVDNLKESKRILENKFSEVWEKEFIQFVSKIFIENRVEIEKDLNENEEKFPISFQLEFDEESNDQGGSDDYISYLYFYDEDDNHIDIESVSVTYEYEDYKGVMREVIGDLYEYVLENIRGNYTTEDIMRFLSSGKLVLNTK